MKNLIVSIAVVVLLVVMGFIWFFRSITDDVLSAWFFPLLGIGLIVFVPIVAIHTWLKHNK